MMNIEEIRRYCLQLKGCTEDFPFDEDTLAFRVGNKIFALTSLQAQPVKVNLKCDPSEIISLRDRYESIQQFAYMNKKHWVTVDFDSGELDNKMLCSLLKNSYQLVLQSLSKINQQKILAS